MLETMEKVYHRVHDANYVFPWISDRRARVLGYDHWFTIITYRPRGTART